MSRLKGWWPLIREPGTSLENHKQGKPRATRPKNGTRGNLCVCSSCPRDGRYGSIRSSSGSRCDMWWRLPDCLAISVRSIVYRLQRRVRDGFSSVTCAGLQWTIKYMGLQGKCANDVLNIYYHTIYCITSEREDWKCDIRLHHGTICARKGCLGANKRKWMKNYGFSVLLMYCLIWPGYISDDGTAASEFCADHSNAVLEGKKRCRGILFYIIPKNG